MLRRSRAVIARVPKFYLFDVGVAGRMAGRWIERSAGSGIGRAQFTFSLRVDGLIKRWLTILAERQDPEAGQALDSLADDPALASWYDVIEEAKIRRRARAIRAGHTV